MQMFHLELSFREASDRFGTTPIVSGTIENLIVHVFRDFQLQHGPQSAIYELTLGRVHNFGMDGRLSLRLVAIERGYKTGL